MTLCQPHEDKFVSHRRQVCQPHEDKVGEVCQPWKTKYLRFCMLRYTHRTREVALSLLGCHSSVQDVYNMIEFHRPPDSVGK